MLPLMTDTTFAHVDAVLPLDAKQAATLDSILGNLHL